MKAVVKIARSLRFLKQRKAPTQARTMFKNKMTLPFLINPAKRTLKNKPPRKKPAIPPSTQNPIRKNFFIKYPTRMARPIDKMNEKSIAGILPKDDS